MGKFMDYNATGRTAVAIGSKGSVTDPYLVHQWPVWPRRRPPAEAVTKGARELVIGGTLERKILTRTQ